MVTPSNTSSNEIHDTKHATTTSNSNKRQSKRKIQQNKVKTRSCERDVGAQEPTFPPLITEEQKSNDAPTTNQHAATPTTPTTSKRRKLNLPSQSQAASSKRIYERPSKVEQNSSQIQKIITRIKQRQLENHQDLELLERENRQLRAKNKELMFMLKQQKSEATKNQQKEEEEDLMAIFQDDMEI